MGPVQDTLIDYKSIYVGPSQRSEVVLFTDWSGWPLADAFHNNTFRALGGTRMSQAISRAPSGMAAFGFGFCGYLVPENTGNDFLGTNLQHSKSIDRGAAQRTPCGEL